MFSNPIEMMLFFKKSKNPKEATLALLEQQAQQNPQYATLLSLVRAGNTGGVEGFVKQMLASQGVDFDKEFNAFRQNWGL